MGNSLLDERLAFVSVDASDTNSLFKFLEGELKPLGYIEDSWLEAISKREEDYPTGLAFQNCAIAIPHTYPEHIRKPYIALVKPSKPIKFEHMANVADPVDASLIINLGITNSNTQIDVLQQLMDIFADEEKSKEIISQTDAKSLHNVITKYLN